VVVATTRHAQPFFTHLLHHRRPSARIIFEAFSTSSLDG
jgi:hypothetical protein